MIWERSTIARLSEMGDTEDMGRYSYLIQTRSGRNEYVVDTIRKYYGELLIDVEKDPNGGENCLIITAVTEIPIEAIERIGGVETVDQLPAEPSNRPIYLTVRQAIDPQWALNVLR